MCTEALGLYLIDFEVRWRQKSQAIETMSTGYHIVLEYRHSLYILLFRLMGSDSIAPYDNKVMGGGFSSRNRS